MEMDAAVEEVLLRYEDPGEFLVSELQEACGDSSLTSSWCDVIFHCKDRLTVSAHSAVLAVISPFLKMVLSDVWDPHFGASISLPDFKYENYISKL